MAGILHDLFIAAPVEQVFAAVSQPALLDEWWTNRCTGKVELGEMYEFYFSPEYIRLCLFRTFIVQI